MPNARTYGRDALKPEAPRMLSEDEKKRHIFMFLRKVQRDQRSIGKRMKRTAKKAAKAEKLKNAKK